MNLRANWILVVLSFLSSRVAFVRSAGDAEAKVDSVECVSGYCLPPDYNKLELPQNVTEVGINAELRTKGREKGTLVPHLLFDK